MVPDDEKDVEVIDVSGKTLRPGEKGIEEKQEDTASRIAYVLIGLYALCIIGLGITAIATCARSDPLFAALRWLIEIQSPLVGVIIGFYFSERRVRARRGF